MGFAINYMLFKFRKISIIILINKLKISNLKELKF